MNFSKVKRQEYDGDTTNPHPEDQMENLEYLAELNGGVKFEELKVYIKPKGNFTLFTTEYIYTCLEFNQIN